jgi:hypothetical protein
MSDPLPLEIGKYYKYDPEDIVTGPLDDRRGPLFGFTNNINNFLYEHRDDIKYFRVDGIDHWETYITVFFNDGTNTDKIVDQPGYLNQRLRLQRDFFRNYPARGNPIREYFKDMEVETAKEIYNMKTNENSGLNTGPTSIIANFLRKRGGSKRNNRKRKTRRRKLSRK